MILAIILSIASILFLCWLLFQLATFALPLFVGVLVAQWSYHAGAGLLGAIVVALLVGLATLIVGQLLIALSRSDTVRLGVALLFVAPAAVAGFSAVHGLAAMGLSSEPWRIVFGLVGAAVVGASAWTRLLTTAVFAPDPMRSDSGSTQSAA